MRLAFAIAAFGLAFNPTYAQWIQTHGPYGGEILAITAIGDTIFAGTNGEGVFLSSDNGGHWTPSGRIRTGIQSFAVNGNTVFAGSNGGVYRSTDTGNSWTNLGPNFEILSLAVHGDTLFAGTYLGGVFRSADNGTTWSEVNNGLTNLEVFSLAFEGHYLFAGTNGSIFRSADHGSSWIPLNNGIDYSATSDPRVYDIAVSGNTLLVGALGGMYRSTDDGDSWSTANNGLTNTAPGIHSIVVSGGDLFASTMCSGVFRSSDDGDNWTQLKTGLINTCVLTLFVNGNNIFAGTSGGGIFLSSDAGNSWTQVNNELNNTYVKSLAAKENILFAGTLGDGVFASTDQGNHWTQLNLDFFTHDLNTTILALAVNGNSIFAGSYFGVSRSTDNGNTWTHLDIPASGPWVECFAFSGTTMFAGLEVSGIIKSTDNGSSWTATGMTNNTVYSLLVSGKNIFAGTFQGVFLSTDNGASWTLANSGLPNTPVYSLAASGNTLIAGVGGGVFISNDSGSSWAAGLSNETGYALLVDGSNIFAGTNEGVSLSSDNGRTWTSLDKDFQVRSVQSLAISRGRLFAGSLLSGVWTYCISPPQPVITVSKAPGNAVTFHSSAEEGNQWFLDGAPIADATGSTFAPTIPGVYTVQVTINGCPSALSVDKVYEIFPDPVIEMPDAFTPNGDTFNPVFVPITFLNIQTASLLIVNRWGQEVYRSQDPAAGWDGGSSDASVYYYLIQFEGKNGTTGKVKGWVQLVR